MEKQRIIVRTTFAKQIPHETDPEYGWVDVDLFGDELETVIFSGSEEEVSQYLKNQNYFII
jgi:hypothetical protein